ncbi:phage major tail tube protein [Lelliottia amnigena]|uniref:phage major tail tube protein n=1 Tax=Lelliottia amnigena TaxID=61646 RepID=UPI00192C8E36|nr:phage major tail tube protein [Lelliottia amnigena]MBL5919781.1 phage major tail tube protein [Lelliottia amnigena]
MNNNFIYSKSALYLQNNIRVAGLRAITPPAIVSTVGNYKTTWMDTSIPVDTGMEAMQMNCKVDADTDVLALFGFVQGRTVRAQIRRTYKDSQQQLHEWVDELEGLISSITPDEHGTDSQESVGNAIVMNLSYYKLTVDGNVIYEIDPANMKRVVNGVDTLAAERQMLLMG